MGDLNKGWTVAKRLLQHERSGIGMLASGTNRESGAELYDLGRRFAGEDGGRIADDDLRRAIAGHYIDAEAYRLTQRRTVEESQGSTPGPQTSIFKYYGANLRKERAELQVSMMGTRGVGWAGDGFGAGELGMTRAWLAGKAGSIAGGSNEVQLNIIAKRVLGLPD